MNEKLFQRFFQVAVVVVSILPVGHQKKRWLLKKVTRNSLWIQEIWGSSGRPPLGCLPLWGREGGHSHNIFKM